MSEQKKIQQDEIPNKFSVQNIRPALRQNTEKETTLDVDSTNNMRPPELHRPIVIPTPPKQTYTKPLLLNEPTRDIPTGCFTFTSWMVLELEIAGTGNSIRVSPTQGSSLVIGRNPETASTKIHIDLTPHATSTDGVSRIHAAIKLEGTRLELEDKNSTNGTSLNGIRFNPNESHPLRSGDVIMLAHFQMIVKFTPRLESNNKHDTNILSPLQ